MFSGQLNRVGELCSRPAQIGPAAHAEDALRLRIMVRAAPISISVQTDRQMEVVVDFSFVYCMMMIMKKDLRNITYHGFVFGSSRPHESLKYDGKPMSPTDVFYSSSVRKLFCSPDLEPTVEQSDARLPDFCKCVYSCVITAYPATTSM